MDNNRSPAVASNCDVSDEEQYSIEHDDDDDSQNYRRMIKDDDEVDKEGIFEIDEQPSTSYHSSVADTSLGSIADSIGLGNLSQPALKRSSIPSSYSKNINKLANIGRSVSENHPDDHDVVCDVEDEDNFIPNERSRSYSQVISNNRTKAQRIVNSQRGTGGGGGGGGRGSDCGVDDGHNSDCNQVSSSLPSFFGNKSVPVSPILHTKGNTMSRETSLSEIPRRNLLLRDSSVQSDSSHCSSVESLLEARKPDPEQILINLGFGPLQSEDVLSKIPKRFLKPSQVRGVDTDCFLRQQQLANHLHDHSVLGYRGLVGNPHIPPSMIVAKIMERFEMNERNRCILDYNLNRPQSAPPTPGPNQ